MVSVDNVNWTESEVAKMSREQFIVAFMSDEGTYGKHDAERKRKALEAVYDICVPKTKAKPSKVAKDALDTPDAE